MTSKISFSKMVLSDIKRRTWLLVILLIATLLVLPLTGAIVLGYEKADLAAGYSDMADVYRNVKMWFSGMTAVIGMGLVVGAILSAFSGFGYLYKKTKLDVFHSIPVKREKLFSVQYVSGILLFVVPVIISYLLMLMVWLVNNILAKDLVLMLFSSLGLVLLHFLMYYNVAILAIMLTGKLIVGILGMLVFWGYAPILHVLIRGLHERFFYTYYYADVSERFVGWIAYLSPVTLQSLWSLNSVRSYMIEETMVQPIHMIIIEIGMILLTLVGAIWLYRKRPSEAAEQAMAFPKTKPVIKVLLMVLISIGLGLFLGLIAGSHFDVWFVFGLVLGLVLTQY